MTKVIVKVFIAVAFMPFASNIYFNILQSVTGATDFGAALGTLCFVTAYLACATVYTAAWLEDSKL